MIDDLKREQDEARRDGATPVKNSGRGIFKCDAILGDFGIDYKHASKSFTLNPSTWAKISTDAWKNGKRNPTLKIVFENGGTPLRLWIINQSCMEDYLRLIELEKNNEI